VQDRQVTAPDTATFSVSASGFDAPFSYQWEKSDDAGVTRIDILGATSDTYTTGATTVAADNGDLYRVRVSNSLDTAYSNWATLTVTGAAIAPTITTQPQNQSVTVGANATFTVVASGTSPAYQWQRSFDGGIVWTDIAGATNASYTLANAQTSDANALYRVRASNAAGTVFSVGASLTVTTPPPPTGVARIAAGNNTSSAVTAAGVLYTWGTYRGAGAPNTSSSTAAPIALAGVRTLARGSSTHGVAVRNDGTVWAWGYSGDVFCNFTGGIIYHTPTQVAGAANIASAGAGTGHTLLLSNTGVVYAFGCNGSGQLGVGSIQSAATAVPVPGLPAGITAIAAGTTFSLALDGNGNVWAWGTVSLVQVAGLSGVRALAAGENHALALKNDGSVSAWGSNSNGKLGDGTLVDRPAPVPTLLTSGIKAVDASSEFSLALREADSVVLSWGINETGQLGSGSDSPGFRVTPAPVAGLTQVQAIAAAKTFSSGLGHSLALRVDGTLWAWGSNMEGQLGNGNTNFSTTPVPVTGLNLN
jgi:alpha-tubulin suppressor-like RCC1 family protein